MPQSIEHTQFYFPQFSVDASTPICFSQKETGLPDQSLCTELVQLYFDYVHDQFHTLFHRPSFIDNLSEGKAPPILVYGMMALSARLVKFLKLASELSMLIGHPSFRFSNNPALSQVDARERGRTYGKQCERLLDWNDISLSTIQACVLLGAIAITDGKAASENIHYAVACRMAQLLDLPKCKNDILLEHEVNIRGILTSPTFDTTLANRPKYGGLCA